MTIQTAIEKAIDGGWENYRPFQDRIYTRSLEPINHEYDYKFLVLEFITKSAILDPQFWQCLGKAMGWEDSDQTYVQPPYTNWRIQWHRMIDHLSDGGTIESYFETL